MILDDGNPWVPEHNCFNHTVGLISCKCLSGVGTECGTP